MACLKPGEKKTRILRQRGWHGQSSPAWRRTPFAVFTPFRPIQPYRDTDVFGYT